MRLWMYLGLVVIFSPPVAATELTHRFVDPSFGGNPLNGNFLMNQAGDQNNTHDAPVVDPNGTKTELQRFTDSLKSSILSGLARAASGSLIDATTGKIIPNHTVSVGGFSVVVGNEIGGAVSIDITDGISSTQLTVPQVNSQ